MSSQKRRGSLVLEDAMLFKNTLKVLEMKISEQLSSTTDSKPSRNIVTGLKWENSLASSASEPCRPDKVIVFIKIVILKLGDIDTMRDKFSADVFIQCKWREPALDGKLTWEKNVIDWDLYWNPRLSLENVIGEPKEQLWHTVTFDHLGQAIICEKRRVTGAFVEFMELYQFPFDTQDLSVSVISDRDQNEVELSEDPKERCLLNVMSFADVQEWKLHDGCTTWKDIREESFNNSNKKRPSFGASCKVSRRPQFFIWNTFVILTLICSLSFATFSVSFTSPQNRLQLTFTLLLTTVSFKFSAYQSLPTIAYLTYLDRYILGLMGILSVICVWHSLAYYVYVVTNCNQSLVGSLDLCACALFASIYVIFHIVFACIIACVKKDSAGHGVPTSTSDDMTFDDDYAEDYSLPFQDLNQNDSSHPVEDTSHVTANNQTVMAACGLD